MQNAETWANNSLRPALAGGPGSSLSTPIHPRESEAGSAEGQGSGAPSVDGRGRLGRSVQKLGRGWRAGGRTDVHRCAFRTARQAVQQAAPVFTVQWLPSWGEPLRGLLEELWQGWRGGGAEARLGLGLGIMSQAGPEGRVGLPLRLATSRGHFSEWTRGPSLPGFWVTHLSRKPSRRRPALPISGISL